MGTISYSRSACVERATLCGSAESRSDCPPWLGLSSLRRGSLPAPSATVSGARCGARSSRPSLVQGQEATQDFIVGHRGRVVAPAVGSSHRRVE